MILIYLGIDIGGNHTAIGFVDENCNIQNEKVILYNRDEITASHLYEQINAYIAENKNQKIESIGIGVPGIALNTKIIYTCNIPLTGTEVRDYIKTDLPIYVSNDAACAAIAEYQLIDKNAYSNYALVTIGTGIGAGIIINGKLYEGATGAAGEIGHTVIERNGILCKCGRKGCFEQYASITALKRMTNLDSLEEIFNAYEKDENIRIIFEEYLENLSIGLTNFINSFDIEMLVIGGGITAYSDRFISKLKEKILEKICNKKIIKFDIKTAVLKNNAGIIGAALLSKYRC